LLVCGGGRITAIRRLVGRFGLEANIHLLGRVDDIRVCYHAADFFVLPTYYDPCSLVVFEALACGLPVITTANNGAGELIEPGREGYVIPSPNDVEALLAALARMADDPHRRIMAQHALRLGQAQSFGNHVERLVRLFVQVAEEKQRLRSGRIASDLRPIAC
jgi:UDP-glucose:(heptosyl)LPS alpha-1,3-glucosyltransferase